jgi:glycosyltransferase involved in cell wall biosynthesis
LKILLVAPQPFFEERGTPIAVDMLARTLCDRGDTVDVLTTHLGREDRYPAGMRVLRVKPPFGPSKIPPGFSLRKVYCDLFIGARLLRIGRRQNYDLIHAVEESSFMAWLLNIFGGPDYVVDVDSSMTDQIVNRFRILRPVAGVIRWLERLPLRRARGVLVVCEALAGPPRQLCSGETMLLPDVSLRTMTQGPAEDLGETLGKGGPILMYVGNLEPYQGIDLLLESFAILEKQAADARLVLIGGSDESQRHYRELWTRLSGSERVRFLGPRPLEALSAYLEQADAVVSPRTEGVNTPMKVYSYMDSGRPLVATALPTHTQVLSTDEAELAPPEPQAFADAMGRVLSDPDHAQRLARNARARVARDHSPESFRSRVTGFYARLEAGIAA